jgi:HEAT repeat protein
MAKTPTLIKSLARAHTETALNVLAGVMNQPDAPASARVSAAEALLSRGWGKPAQAITGGDEDDNPVRLIVTGVKRAGEG